MTDVEILESLKSYTSKPEVIDRASGTLKFAEWVAREIFDENWELNKDAFEELACRKLEKLGIVRANGDEWELVRNGKVRNT